MSRSQKTPINHVGRERWRRAGQGKGRDVEGTQGRLAGGGGRPACSCRSLRGGPGSGVLGGRRPIPEGSGRRLQPGSGPRGGSALEKEELWQQHGPLEAAEPDDGDFI